MTYTVTITSQGQLSIPAKLRRELGFSKTNQVLLSVDDGKIILEPVKDLLEMGGALKTDKKPLTDEEMDEFIAQAVVDNLIKKGVLKPQK